MDKRKKLNDKPEKNGLSFTNPTYTGVATDVHMALSQLSEIGDHVYLLGISSANKIHTYVSRLRQTGVITGVFSCEKCFILDPRTGDTEVIYRVRKTDQPVMTLGEAKNEN